MRWEALVIEAKIIVKLNIYRVSKRDGTCFEISTIVLSIFLFFFSSVSSRPKDCSRKARIDRRLLSPVQLEETLGEG